jgi:hypothetical protein
MKTLTVSILAGFGLLLSSCGSGGSRLVSVDPGSPIQSVPPTTFSFVVQIGSSYGDPVVVDVSDPLLVTVRLD